MAFLPPTHLQPFLLDFIHLLFLHQRQEFPRLVDGAQEVLRQTLPLVGTAAAVFVCKRTETGRFADSPSSTHLQASWTCLHLTQDAAAHLPLVLCVLYLSHLGSEAHQTSESQIYIS